MASALPVLVQLLRDPLEKTRANAAGAIGNFSRNADTLDGKLVAYDAPGRLFHLVVSEPNPSHITRVALFSLGSLANHPLCRAVLQRINIRDRLVGHMSDAISHQYLKRLLKKLT